MKQTTHTRNIFFKRNFRSSFGILSLAFFSFFLFSCARGEIDSKDPSLTNAALETGGKGFTVGTLSDNTTEIGGTATFTVVLKDQPAADVSIAVVSSDTTEGKVSPASLTFGSGNWSTTQTVTITGQDDNDTDGDKKYTIQLGAASSTDANYSGINPSDVSVVNIDNESASL